MPVKILVPINMCQVIQLDGRYGEVSIGNSDIADVVPLTTSSIYVFGKQFGTTSLTVTGSEGRGHGGGRSGGRRSTSKS